MHEMTSPMAMSPGIRPDIARRRIQAFRDRFGDAHLYLAFHAAFPLVLTPDLLYRLRANFQRDVHNEELNVPWIAVADLLLSRLCNEVGYELYEMDVAMRAELLSQLKSHPRFGPQRIYDLSNFLRTYVKQQLVSPSPGVSKFAQAQDWMALAATKPDEAARSIALTLSELNPDDWAEFARIASLIEAFIEPSAELTRLLTHARAMEIHARGDEENTKAELSKVTVQGRPQELSRESIPKKQAVVLNISKALMGVSFTTLKTIGSASGNVKVAELAAIPAAVLAVESILAKLKSEEQGVLELPVPSWWTSDASTWNNICTEIDAHLPNIFRRMSMYLQREHGLVTIQTVHQIFIEAVLDEQLVVEVDPQQWKNVATEIAAPVLEKVEEVLKTAFEAIRVRIFITYSHKDKRWLEKLQIMLTPLIGEGMIKTWADTQIEPGTKWREEISEALAFAKVAVMLVTPNFLASDFITKHELLPLLKTAEKDGLLILWIAVSASMFQVTGITDYQALNNPSKPLDSLTTANVNKEMIQICERIKQIAQNNKEDANFRNSSLTDLQKRIYEFIVEYIRDEGMSPTNREIGSAMKIAGTGHVDYHLSTLEKKGYITRDSKKSRGIKLVQHAFGIPVMGSIRAGEPLEIFTDPLEAIEVGRNLEGTYALVVMGSGLIEDHILDRDYVFIKPQVTCEHGDIVVAVHLQGNGRTILRRFFQENERDRIRLQPANSEMDPIYIPRSEWDNEWQIQGKVVAILRKYRAV